MNIQFLGATLTVTGSKYLIKTNDVTVLVDCGLYQGYKELRLRNWAPLPIPAKDIDYILLTHAHIDHSGYIPLIVKKGFRGKILCTEATRDLCSILLPDSGHLHEEEASYAQRKGYSKHHPPLPLYTEAEARESLAYFDPIPFNKTIQLGHSLFVDFHYAGHILGAAFLRVQHDKTQVVFSGDLGRQHDPMLYPPSPPPQADYYVIESTYGNRLHDANDPMLQLAEIINKTIKKGGVILIPSFAVGRAQNILYYLHQLRQNDIIPYVPISIDSPMATDATKIYYQHNELHRLDSDLIGQVCKTANFTHTVEESKQLDITKVPQIIISASGMATGGRILHHIRQFAPNHKNAIVFCGYQAGGTRGDHIVSGDKEIKMFGQMVPVRAKVYQLHNTSAHADYQEMLQWLSHIKRPPRKIFITHGEAEAAHALEEKIKNIYGFECLVPEYLYEEQLD